MARGSLAVMKARSALLAVLASVVLSGCGSSGGTGTSAATTPAAETARRAPPVAGSLQQTYVAVYARVAPSVVQITTSVGLGSGIVFDGEGDIVTNAHVVGTESRVLVTTSRGVQLEGRLVGTFASADLAVIQVAGADLPPAVFADSSAVSVGDVVLAIGNPLGLSSSVTDGIVSALGRRQSESNGVTLVDTIQTSAAINPGNSGGALVDISARVVGVPTLAAVDPELGSAAAGIGFAIPSNVVTAVAGQILEHGR
jgi:S1-C subfamily serine protease